MTNITRDLGAFAAELKFEQIPAAALDVIHTGFADCVGVMLAGRDEPPTQILTQVLAPPPGPATLVFGARTASATDAAWINGVAAHALDFDDVAIKGHPSTVLVPAILAEAQELGSSGKDMIVAYAVGYEVWAELARRDPEHYHTKGWHPTGILGSIGAAAACASLHKLNAEQCAMAISLGASQSAGIMANFGTMTKPFHAGRAASHGIDAVRLSKLGMTSATDVFEHPAGYLFALSLSGRADLKRPADTLGKTLRILDSGLSIKRYPVCYSSHRTIDGVLAIVERENLKAEDISKVHVTMGHAQASMLRNKHPMTGLEAKFSAQFAVASAVVARQVGLSQLTDAFATRPDVSELYGKVSVTTVNTVCPFEPAFALTDRVVIETTGGKKFDSGEIRFPLGNAKNPIDAAGLKAKFMDCVATGKAENPAMHGADAGLYDRIAGLENLPSVQSLFGK